MAEWKPWLEMELAQQLRPVGAPEELWDRINNPHRAPSRVPWHGALRVSAFAAAILVVSAVMFWQTRNHLRDMAQITAQDLRVLADPSTGYTFRSEDPRQIRKWVKSKGNIEIELPSSPTGAVHLLGAKLVELRGTLIAAVAYHVGDDSATLLVSRKRTMFWDSNAESKHLFSRVATSQGTSLFSWSMREQNYAIAWAGVNDPQGACLLCHADLHGRL